MAAYALSIFTGAFLLFQVQPLMGKYILPWFGGGTGVWTTCMLFFQVLLLAGYGYAHVISKLLKPRTQAVVHVALLILALALLPIVPAETWKPSGASNPTWQILKLLTLTLGLPYLALSATGPLLQQWLSCTHPEKSPYRLYALSNAGSLLALLSYPFFFEAHFSRPTQARLWGWGLGGFALVCAFCAYQMFKSQGTGGVGSNLHSSGSNPPSVLQRALWLLLPACASVLLLAMTNKLCQDIAVVPLLWVLPLSIYLLSFIVCFDSPRWYARFPFTLGLVGSEVLVCWGLFKGSELSIGQQVVIYSFALFVFCMVCHGELYRLRPKPDRLTEFYLWIAAGGALGGVFVAVVAPLIFTDYYELHWGLLSCAGLFVFLCMLRASGRQEMVGLSQAEDFEFTIARASGASAAETQARGAQAAEQDYWRWTAWALTVLGFAGLDWFMAHFVQDPGEPMSASVLAVRIVLWAGLGGLVIAWWRRGKLRTFQHWPFAACSWLVAGLGALCVGLWLQGQKAGGEVVYMSRNFYGVLTIYEEAPENPKEHHYRLQHGRITHGLQFTDDERAQWPTAYYGPKSGVGVALQALPAGRRRIGVVGEGIGTVATYAQPGDYLRIYEINPEVSRLATERFKYLANCHGKTDLVLGDARLSLEREQPQNFDLLALDAFNSDAIPVHLLTREAFEVYERHLKPGGVIAVHISNHHLDLVPVIINAARQFHYNLAPVDFQASDQEWWLYSSTWMLLTHSPELLNAPCIRDATYAMKTNIGTVRLWTDDFASLAQILK